MYSGSQGTLVIYERHRPNMDFYFHTECSWPFLRDSNHSKWIIVQLLRSLINSMSPGYRRSMERDTCGKVLLNFYFIRIVLSVRVEAHSNVWCVEMARVIYNVSYARDEAVINAQWVLSSKSNICCKFLLGHSQYIVWSTNSDKGVLCFVGGKKMKIWILIKMYTNRTCQDWF